jgi:site-specific DNA-cytosine methylase
MKVLSLFDGISCGREALKRAGIQVDVYYASEIDSCATEISQKNWPDIVRLGDVERWKEWDICWEEIDLLLGGSPCQGFSKMGKQLNFDDPRSRLFFVYAEIKEHLQKVNPGVKFLLENVNMRKEYRAVISDRLGVEPVRIKSELVSAARRDRWYWANFDVTVPVDKEITFDDIYDKNEQNWIPEETIERVKKWKAQQDPLKNAVVVGARNKLPCLTARGYNQYHSGMVLVKVGNRYRYLSNGEAEAAMTLPHGYTEGASDKQRAQCIGNGWTVDVIAHILKGLKTHG